MESKAEEKKKILHITMGAEIGGTEQMLTRVLPELTSFSHTVLCLSGEGTLSERLQESAIAVVPLKVRNIFFDFVAIKNFKHIVQENQFDAIITYLPMADLFGVFWGRIFGVKKIACSLRSTWRDIRYAWLIALEVALSPFIDCFIAVSNAVKDRFSNFGIPARKITTVPNGIPPSFQKELSPEERSAVRSRLGLEPEGCIFTVVGRLRKERGQKYVIKAFLQALESLPNNSSLLIIGDGPDRAKLEHLTQSLNLSKHIHFLGFRKDIPELLQASDVVISSSLYEGMSNALLETMAAKCAIIAIDVPENRELITQDASGLFAGRKNIASMTHAMITLGNNPDQRKRLGSNANEAAKNFSLEKSVTQFHDFLTVFTQS